MPDTNSTSITNSTESKTNVEFEIDITIIGVNVIGMIKSVDGKKEILVDTRSGSGNKITFTQVLVELQNATGIDSLSDTVSEVLSFVGIQPAAEVSVIMYFRYDGTDEGKAEYAFKIEMNSPKSGEFKLFAINRLMFSVSNCTPPELKLPEPDKQLEPDTASA